MKKITTQEMLDLMSEFQGKQIEIDLSPIQASNTYHWFKSELLRDTIIFSDMDNEHPQQLQILVDDISDIDCVECQNVFERVFTIDMVDNTQIQICVHEKPIRCFRCGKIIETPNESLWIISGQGNYGSYFDGENLDLKLCDNCLANILEYKDGIDCE